MTRIIPSREIMPPIKKVRNNDFRKAWARDRYSCYWCGTNYRIHTHHIIGAAGRSDEPCNLSRFCGPCHDEIHADWRGTFKRVIEAKEKHDLHEMDLERLRVLYQQELPL